MQMSASLKNSTLYYLMGASGSGKDSILRYFRQHYSQDCGRPIVIAHRYITRESDETENAISLTPREFALRKEHHFFALDWQAHDLSYGIGVEVNHWLEQGVNVLLNGSRAYLQEAKKKYGKKLHSILVDVDDNLLEQRLLSRQREENESLEKRLQRHGELKNTINADDTIINNASIERAAQSLAQIIDGKN